MHIERFHISGYKSISSLQIDGLSDVNVFYGLNSAGRSNIFQALSLWRWLLSSVEAPQGQLSLMPQEHLVPWEQVSKSFSLPLFRLGGNNRIRLGVELLVC